MPHASTSFKRTAKKAATACSQGLDATNADTFTIKAVSDKDVFAN
jgi:hypothetical protein